MHACCGCGWHTAEPTPGPTTPRVLNDHQRPPGLEVANVPMQAMQKACKIGGALAWTRLEGGRARGGSAGAAQGGRHGHVRARRRGAAQSARAAGRAPAVSSAPRQNVQTCGWWHVPACAQLARMRDAARRQHRGRGWECARGPRAAGARAAPNACGAGGRGTRSAASNHGGAGTRCVRCGPRAALALPNSPHHSPADPWPTP